MDHMNTLVKPTRPCGKSSPVSDTVEEKHCRAWGRTPGSNSKRNSTTHFKAINAHKACRHRLFAWSNEAKFILKRDQCAFEVGVSLFLVHFIQDSVKSE
jgi:hypothetical protein